MFCPICKAEYRQGFTRCNDCDADLVETLPPEPSKSTPEFVDYAEYKEVLTTFNPMDIAFIKSILDAEEITYFVQGEHFLNVRPLALPARLMVKIDQVEQAVELLKDLRLSFSGINLSKDTEADL
jgi:hypothetical protein